MSQTQRYSSFVLWNMTWYHRSGLPGKKHTRKNNEAIYNPFSTKPVEKKRFSSRRKRCEGKKNQSNEMNLLKMWIKDGIIRSLIKTTNPKEKSCIKIRKKEQIYIKSHVSKNRDGSRQLWIKSWEFWSKLCGAHIEQFVIDRPADARLELST